MSLQNITDVKRALKALLTGTLFLQHLTAVAAELGVTLPDVPIHSVYRTDKLLDGIEGFPAAEIIGSGSDPDPESDCQVYDHQVTIVWSLIGDAEETLTDLVEAYVLATRRITFEQLLPGVGNVPVKPGREDYSLLQPRPGDNTLLKSGAIEMVVGTIG